nr:hypothetical protein [Tanacetum cinerariifolium]
MSNQYRSISERNGFELLLKTNSQRQVAGESPTLSLGKAVNVVFESGGASGSGGCGDEEEGVDHQDDEDEDGDGDT